MRALKYFSGKTDYDTKIKVYLIDSNGGIAAARYNTAKVTYQDGSTGTVDCTNAGYAYQGFSCVANSQSKYLSQAIRTYSLTKDNFQLYETYSPGITEVDYSSITKVIVETWTPEINGTFYQYEVMNLSTNNGNGIVNLFSATTAKEATSRNVGANEWYFDSIPTANPYTEEEKSKIPVIVEQVKARDGGITLFNDSDTNASFWLRSYGKLENGESDTNNFQSIVDYSKYDHIAFYADTTECVTDVNVEIKLYWADPEVEIADANRYFRAGSASFYYVPDEGEPYYGTIPSGSYIEKGFKGYVYLDLSTFLQDGVGGSYLTYERQQKLAKNIRFIFNAKNDYKLINGLEGVSKLKIRDVKFVEANKSTLVVEKIFTNMNLDFKAGTTVEEILESLPTELSIGADIVNSLITQDKTKTSVENNKFLQIEGKWTAGEIDDNGLIELTFIPSADSTVSLNDDCIFKNNTSFTFIGYVAKEVSITPPSSSETISSEEIEIPPSSSEIIDSSISSEVINNPSSSFDSSSEPSENKPTDTKGILLKIGIGFAATLVIAEVAIVIILLRRKK